MLTASKQRTKGRSFPDSFLGFGRRRPIRQAPELIQKLRAYLQLRINRDMQGIFAMDAGGLLGRG